MGRTAPEGSVRPRRSRARFPKAVPRSWAALAALGLLAAWAAPPAAVAGSQAAAEPDRNVERMIDRGLLAEAAAALQERIESQGETARDLLLRGMILYGQGRYESALADLNRSFSRDQGDPDTSKALGLCLVRLGREDLAETFFEIAAKLAPEDAMAHYYLGLNAYTTKRFERAAASFARACELDSGSADSRSFLGRSHEALGNAWRAAAHYEKAVELNRAGEAPSGVPPLLLGSMLYRQSRLERAEALLRESLRYDERGQAHYWLGLLLERKSAFDDAIRSLGRAAAAAPSDHRPHYALARVYRRSGKHRDAASALRRFRELRSRSQTETFSGGDLTPHSASGRPKQ